MDVASVAGAATATVAVCGVAAAFGRGAWRISRGIDQLSKDLLGEPERPGVPARPGVMERLGGIDKRLDTFDTRLHGVEKQINPNGGKSLHDKVDQTLAAVTTADEPA